MQLAAADIDDALGQIDAARRVSRGILRRRALALGGVTLAYLAWAAGTGGVAWIGLAPLLAAGCLVAAQLAAPPGRDFREGLRCALLPHLGPGIAHAHRPPGIGLGPIVSDAGWVVEDRLDGPGWSLLSARHRDGRGLLLGRTGGEPPSEMAWALPAPLLSFTWDRPVAELRGDLERLRRAVRELEAG